MIISPLSLFEKYWRVFAFFMVAMLIILVWRFGYSALTGFIVASMTVFAVYTVIFSLRGLKNPEAYYSIPEDLSAKPNEAPLTYALAQALKKLAFTPFGKTGFEGRIQEWRFLSYEQETLLVINRVKYAYFLSVYADGFYHETSLPPYLYLETPVFTQVDKLYREHYAKSQTIRIEHGAPLQLDNLANYLDWDASFGYLKVRKRFEIQACFFGGYIVMFIPFMLMVLNFLIFQITYDISWLSVLSVPIGLVFIGASLIAFNAPYAADRKRKKPE